MNLGNKHISDIVIIHHKQKYVINAGTKGVFYSKLNSYTKIYVKLLYINYDITKFKVCRCIVVENVYYN